MVRTVAVAVVLALALPTSTRAQWGDFLQDKLRQGADAAAGAAAQRATEQKPEEPQAEPVPAKSKAARAEAAEPAPAKKSAAPADEVAAGEVFGNKFDFVPGDKVLVFDDFTETQVGDYPARWTIKDGGGGNPTEVVSYKGRKWWRSVPGAEANSASVSFLRYRPKGDMPQKFTIEFDADMAGKYSVIFNTRHGHGGNEVWFHPDRVWTPDVSTSVKPLGPVVKRISISVNGTYLKVYVGGSRVLQDPDAVPRPLERLGILFDQMYGDDLSDHQMITAFRLAEGGKDIAQAINTDGRIVVHGIYFDTGSDVIRPESGGALRSILELLQNDAALRFRIEGHTDDQGGPKVNGPLSERRAASVKAWLVSQGVDAKRLEPKGLGATKPIDVNTTQEGRANNRRVEFVKLGGGVG